MTRHNSKKLAVWAKPDMMDFARHSHACSLHAPTAQHRGVSHSPNALQRLGKRLVAPYPFPPRRWFMWFIFRRDIAVSAPADTTPIPIGDLLIEGWAYRKTCIDVGDCVGILTWLAAFDALLDRLLNERPDFAIYSAGLVAA